MLPGKATFLALLSLGALVAMFIVIAAPASAVPSIDYVVNTVNDEAGAVHGPHECETEQGHCSLRAAIELVDEEEEAVNKISFDPTVFNGEEAAAVRVQTTSLPPIDFPTTIEAGANCTTATIVGAPCAGVTGLTGEPVFVVDADNTTIRGLSISEGSVGIEVDESTGFEATGNWIGIEMSGSNALPASATGILLGHGSDGAVIGGSATGERNVIAFNEVGLDIDGASQATVRGNWFGMAPNGEDPGPQKIDVKITNFEPTPGTEVKAEDNEIGAALSETAQKSAECDGGCNVISGAQEGILLFGANPLDVPASGPTTIHGNYIGLDAAGNEAVKVEGHGGLEGNGPFEGNRFAGISAGSATDVTVGGDPASEGNYIVGGSTGISTEDSSGFEARGNAFGYLPSGAASAPQTTRAVYVFVAGTTEAPVIAKNRILMGDGGTGIEHHYIGATIVENMIKGGQFGITSAVTATPAGSLIEGNRIEDAASNGIRVANADNEILGNTILRSGDTGIEIESATAADDGNVVGGETPESENVISDGGGFPIVIAGDEGTRNEIQANHGSGNEGERGFIVLEDVPNEPANGVEEPVVETAHKTEASGKAEPGAVVRVFYKASAESGELGGYLGKATAEPDGSWKVTYNAPVPGETRITATQTLDGGTSTLAETVKTPLDPPPPVCPEAGATGCAPPLPAPTPTPDTTPPQVTIKKAPKAKSTSTTAKFVFSASEAGSTFNCKLDGKAFANCKSPKTYKKLKPGKHVFKVKASDAAGNVSAVITKKFTVLAQ